MSRPDEHERVVAQGLPSPIGPYSPAVAFDRLVFVSGQGATDPATGELAGADIEAQTEQVFRNIDAILRAAGTDLSFDFPTIVEDAGPGERGLFHASLGREPDHCAVCGEGDISTGLSPVDLSQLHSSWSQIL